MRFNFSFLTFLLLLIPGILFAENQTLQEKGDLHVVIEDIQGDSLEGYLRLDPRELTVSTKDNQEKSVPLKLIESIKLEKIREGIPGTDDQGERSYYSIRMQNSQEIFTLKKKYTFSLNTSVGLVTKTIDPEMLQHFLHKTSSSVPQSQGNQPFVRDKSVILNFEIKF